jgi:ubiquinone/menaquinone biosynthesis C-methylase UbiE
MVVTTKKQSEFWSKIAGKYDSVIDSQIGANTRAMVRERLEREKNLGVVAEFGCGGGFYTEVLAARAERVKATDLAPGMLAVAKQNVRAANVTFQQEDCQQTSFADASIDTAFLSLVLHFTEPSRALAEMRRILKPGGTLIISNPDPALLSGFDRFRWLARGYFYGITRYRTKPPKGLFDNVLTEKQLCELLVKGGFDIQSTEVIRNAARPYNLPLEYIKAAKNGATPSETVNTAAEVLDSRVC